MFDRGAFRFRVGHDSCGGESHVFSHQPCFITRPAHGFLCWKRVKYHAFANEERDTKKKESEAKSFFHIQFQLHNAESTTVNFACLPLFDSKRFGRESIEVVFRKL